MKKLMFLVVLMIAGLAFVGAKRGWYHVSTEGDDGKSNVTVSVDKDKIREDKAKVVEKVHSAEGKAAEKAADVKERVAEKVAEKK